MEHCYLAFDLGASSGRAVVGKLSDGHLDLQEVHRFETPVLDSDGSLRWDIHALWNEVREGVRVARLSYPALRSISIDSWALDYVSLDPNHEVLTNPYCYRDPRTRGRLEDAFERVPPSEIYECTGIQMMEINTLPQLLAELDEEPDLTANTDLRLFIADYLLYRMGGRAIAERTMASTTQLMGVRTGAWDDELMRRFGIPTDQWPEIVSPGTVIGRVSPELAGGAEIAIVAGCSHDTASAVAGVPAQSEMGRWAYISCGTWSLLGAELDKPLISEDARAANFTNESGLDGSIRFLKNLTGLWVLQECEREWREQGHDFSYAQLLDQARRAASLGDVVDLERPGFRERGRMIEKLQSYCRQNQLSQPEDSGEIVRLILESLAAGYRSTLETLETLLAEPIDVIHVVGGGCQNELLCRWTAEASGRPVLAGPVEAAVMGNLLVQARTLGHLPAATSIRDVVRQSSRLTAYQPSDEAGILRPAD